MKKEKINEKPKLIFEDWMPIWDEKWFSDTIKEIINDPRIIPYSELENAKEITNQL